MKIKASEATNSCKMRVEIVTEKSWYMGLGFLLNIHAFFLSGFQARAYAFTLDSSSKR